MLQILDVFISLMKKNSTRTINLDNAKYLHKNTPFFFEVSFTRDKTSDKTLKSTRNGAFSELMYNIFMQFEKTENTYIIRINKGEQVLETLTNFCIAKSIKNARFDGIGAVEWLKCGYYELSEKKYYFKDYEGLYEVVSLTGNVMLKNNAPFIHAHGVFTDTENSAFGGHIVEMRVGVVLEVMLTPLQSEITRSYDECIGLYLMDIKK